jgi:hypothetical protein
MGGAYPYMDLNAKLLPYVEWDRFVTLTGAQAEWGLRYRIYNTHSSNDKTYLYYAPADRKQILQGHIYYLFLSTMAPYVYSRDGRSLSIYGSECQI